MGEVEKEYDGKKVYVVGFTGKAKINRNDFYIGPGFSMGNDVKISFTMEFIKK